MSSVSMENFYQDAEAADRQEAYTVHRFFESAAAIDLPYKERLDYATVNTHAEFEALAEVVVPYKENFGYLTAKNALRWWNYRNAFINDIAPGQFTEEELAHQRTEQVNGGEYLAKPDPLYFGFYAKLEEMRTNQAIRGQHFGAPLELEREYALTLLMNTIDEALEREKAVQPDEEGSIDLRLDTAHGAFDATLTRTPGDGLLATSYEISLFLPREEEFEDPETTERKPLMAYEVVEQPTGVAASGNWDALDYEIIPLFRTETVLDVCRAISPGDDYSFDRPGTPIKELRELAEPLDPKLNQKASLRQRVGQSLVRLVSKLPAKL